MAKDKEKNREYQRAWYERNKHRTEIFREKKQRRRKSRKDLIDSFRSKGCSNCDEKDPVCLDFHHIDPKTKKFSIGSASLAPYKDLMEELQKCIVLCANCHRKIHKNAPMTE